ncbi:MAG: PD-(D/E)XK nuclease family protein [Acutalibacteraceae bacterium]
MLHFVTGRVGSGKTNYLHSLIADLVKEKNEKVLLIVPKQFTFESDIGILDALGPKDACNVEVLSFSRLADTVLKTCRGINKPPLTDGANAVIMSLALESINDRLHFFSKHSTNMSFVKKMLSQVADFKKNAVTPKQLGLAAGFLPDGILKEKALETALIYDTYNTVCEKSFYDENDLLLHVYNILLENDFFSGKTIAIDDFGSFSSQQMKIISLMLRDANDVYITACTDDIQNSDDSSPFACVNYAMRRIKREADKRSVKTAKTIYLTDQKNGFETYNAKELQFLEQNLYNPASGVYQKQSDAVTLFFAPTVREECDYAASRIKKLIRTGKYRCRDIAVVYRNEVPYEKQIRTSLKKYGVPIFEDKRQNIENEPLIIAVRSLLEIFTNGFSTENLMAYLKTGLSGISDDEIACAENYALMWNFNANGWKQEWTDNPDGFGIEMDEDRAQRLAALNETRKKITQPITAFCENMKGADGKQAMTVIYNFLTENHIDENLKAYAIKLEESGNFELAKEQEQVWDILMNVLDQIANVLEDKTVTPKRLKEIFMLVVSVQSLGKLPDGFDEVYICSCDRIATIMPKVIFAVGANEEKFPKPFEESGIFGGFEKERLREFLPELKDDARSQTMNERFMVYNTICSAREKLFVSWALTDTAGQKMVESELVFSIRKILPQAEIINVSAADDEFRTESEKAAFELLAKNWNSNTPKAKALKEYFSTKDEYKNRIEAIERASTRKDFAFENKETAKELFGKNIRLSATKLENYEKCPFMFFCSAAMKAKPRKIARLDPAQSGTLVHYVLEKLLKSYDTKSFLDAPRDELKAEVDQLLEEYIETYMGGTSDKSERFMYLYSRMRKTMSAIIERLFADFADSDFEPCDFELKIEYDGKIKPFKVELEDGFIELFGIVDRVDKMDKDGKTYIRVVDYKSGTQTFSLSDILQGLSMQMLLYLVCICRTGKSLYGENIVPAGVLYVPARFDSYKINRNDSENEITEKRIADGKMQGMILDDETVIEGMSKSLSPLIIPISVDKRSGKISGNFISLEQMGVLAKKMDKIMADMGNELHEGHIPARPVYRKNRGCACDYCDYKSVCMSSEGVKVRYLEELKHSQCLFKLDEEGREDAEKLD